MEDKTKKSSHKALHVLESKTNHPENKNHHPHVHPEKVTLKRKRDLPVHLRPDFWLMILAGCLMAFQAGFINVTSILKTGLVISHNTGTASKLGISLGSFDFRGIWVSLILLLSFLAGSSLIGFFIRRQVFDFNRKYGIFFMVESVILFFFKCSFDAGSPTLGLLFGSFACGLQNALLTNLSGAVVRTTHVTGMMTDTGLVLGNWIRYKSECKEVWRLKVFVPIIISYILGAAFSKILFGFFDYKAIMFSVLFIGISGLLIVLWRLLKKYNYSVFKQYKEKLIGEKCTSTQLEEQNKTKKDNGKLQIK